MIVWTIKLHVIVENIEIVKKLKIRKSIQLQILPMNQNTIVSLIHLNKFVFAAVLVGIIVSGFFINKARMTTSNRFKL